MRTGGLPFWCLQVRYFGPSISRYINSQAIENKVTTPQSSRRDEVGADNLI